MRKLVAGTFALLFVVGVSSTALACPFSGSAPKDSKESSVGA